jgi:hypothetical protein
MSTMLAKGRSSISEAHSRYSRTGTLKGKLDPSNHTAQALTAVEQSQKITAR